MARLMRPRLLITSAAALLAFAPAHAQPENDLPALHPPVTLGVADDEQGRSPYALLPEGTFLSNRLVRVTPIGTHALAAVFLRTEDETPIRPMALLPCANTLAIEQLAGSSDGTILFEATGQVFVSKGLNYFLPLYVRVATPDAPEPDPAPADQPKEPAERPPLLEDVPDDITVEGLIEELEAATAADASIRSETERPISLQREGGVVTLRRGRLTSGGTGVPIFTFDVGINAEDPSLDSPMGLMPCSLTDEMQRIASRRGDHVTMTVSGRVFLYNEANYLLPTMFFTNPSGEGGLSSAQ